MLPLLYLVLVLHAVLSYYFIKVLNKDINWAVVCHGGACILCSFFAYSMRVYFYNKLYKNLKGNEMEKVFVSGGSAILAYTVYLNLYKRLC